MKKRILKPLALLLLVLVLLGSGFFLYHYQRVTTLTTRLQEAKNHRARSKTATTTTDDRLELTRSNTPSTVSQKAGDRNQPKSSGPRYISRTRQVSACNDIYQKYIENRKFTDVVRTMADELQDLLDGNMDNDPCVQEIVDVIDFDHAKNLLLQCEAGMFVTEESKRSCFTLMALGWGAFAETQFQNMDPAEIPADALHSKIVFRLIEKDDFLKNATQKEKEYLFRLMDQMRKINPKIDYGSTRDELIAGFYQRDPETWKDDYSRVVEELESIDIIRAIMTFYMGHGYELNDEFFSYVDGLTKRNPKSQIAYFYKSCAYTGIKDWDGASKEASEAERLQPDLNKKLFPPLRKAIAEKRPYIYIVSSVSISIEMPGT